MVIPKTNSPKLTLYVNAFLKIDLWTACFHVKWHNSIHIGMGISFSGIYISYLFKEDKSNELYEMYMPEKLIPMPMCIELCHFT